MLSFLKEILFTRYSPCLECMSLQNQGKLDHRRGRHWLDSRSNGKAVLDCGGGRTHVLMCFGLLSCVPRRPQQDSQCRGRVNCTYYMIASRAIPADPVLELVQFSRVWPSPKIWGANSAHSQPAGCVDPQHHSGRRWYLDTVLGPSPLRRTGAAHGYSAAAVGIHRANRSTTVRGGWRASWYGQILSSGSFHAPQFGVGWWLYFDSLYNSFRIKTPIPVDIITWLPGILGTAGLIG